MSVKAATFLFSCVIAKRPAHRSKSSARLRTSRGTKDRADQAAGGYDGHSSNFCEALIMDKVIAGHLYAMRHAIGMALRVLANDNPETLKAFREELGSAADAVTKGFRIPDEDVTDPEAVTERFLEGMNASFAELERMLTPR